MEKEDLKNQLLALGKLAMEEEPEVPFPMNSMQLLLPIGWWSPSRRFMYFLTDKYKPKLTVEIGTCHGLSAIHLAFGNKKGLVYTIDIDEKCGNRLDGYDFIKDLPNLYFRHESSLEAGSKFLDSSIDILFIDGDHTYKGATEDYKGYFPKVKEGGIILIDDIIMTEEMNRFWNEIKEFKFEMNYLRERLKRGFGVVIK